MRPASPSEIFFCQIPNLQHLCSVLVRFPSSETNEQNSQPHILKCRELIFTDPEIIGTPLFKEKTIQLIMQQSYFKSGRLQIRLEKMCLLMDKPKRVIPVDFQACFKYTLLAKIAPMWNTVAGYLIQDFDVNVNEKECYLILKPHVLSLPFIELQDLGIPNGILAEFRRHHHNMIIPEYSIQNKWCHILPSMKKGQIVSISRSIPTNSPFKFYKDVKKYWKNTYGYRLPETDENVFYFQVYFKPIGDNLFTYPNMCLRRTDPVFNARPDAECILEGFFTDLKARMPFLCGSKFTCSCKPQFVQISSLTAAEKLWALNYKTSDQRQNLSSRNPNSLPTVKNRPMEMMAQRSHEASNSESGAPCSQAVVTKLKPVFKPMMKPKVTPSISISDAAVPKTVPMFKALQQPKAPKIADIFPQSAVFSPSVVPSGSASAEAVVPLKEIQPKIISFVKSAPKLGVLQKSSKMPVKRPAQTTTGEDKAKKVKAKPKIMDSVNVEQLARANQLVKVNAATLQAWLKNKRIISRSKDKKGDLVIKVHTALGIPLPDSN
ncbi:hypothetical protein CAPTEDRAFT_198419 [Capitella teleta]|uniref:DUF4708 domain-containing protein n=1 Tax=Capitella teleta TaxID=283909 RepID=R7TDI2_CAPTE|nr:hypothetical protein CAPTEDRAFT_198419 [Capitella teleta]|eukprot:ELT91567.1 hypothetical protein CAPTEDRAFT_198419 [Capitella teleta]